jgi:hypothetical protein
MRLLFKLSLAALSFSQISPTVAHAAENQWSVGGDSDLPCVVHLNKIGKFTDLIDVGFGPRMANTGLVIIFLSDDLRNRLTDQSRYSVDVLLDGKLALKTMAFKNSYLYLLGLPREFISGIRNYRNLSIVLGGKRIANVDLPQGAGPYLDEVATLCPPNMQSPSSVNNDVNPGQGLNTSVNSSPQQPTSALVASNAQSGDMGAPNSPERKRAMLRAELAEARKDIESECPGHSASSREDCAALREQESDLIAELGGASHEDLREDRRDRARQTGMAQAQQYMQQQEALRAALTPRADLAYDRQNGPARRSDPPPMASPQSAAPFGPLPYGAGTPAQQSFWASRCQTLPNDGSSAALGCRQSYEMITQQTAPAASQSPQEVQTAAPSQRYSAPSPSYAGGQPSYPTAATGRGHHSELVANQCVRTEFKKDGQVFTNGCSATIGMAWCHEGYNCPGDNSGKGQLSIELRPGEHYTSWGNAGLQLRFGACNRSSGHVTVELAAGHQVRCLTNG